MRDVVRSRNQNCGTKSSGQLEICWEKAEQSTEIWTGKNAVERVLVVRVLPFRLAQEEFDRNPWRSNRVSGGGGHRQCQKLPNG